MYELPQRGLSPSPRGSPPLTGYAARSYMILLPFIELTKSCDLAINGCFEGPLVEIPFHSHLPEHFGLSLSCIIIVSGLLYDLYCNLGAVSTKNSHS